MFDFGFQEVYEEARASFGGGLLGSLSALGAKGPRQRKCEKAGGRWLGPKGHRSCVMPPNAPIPGYGAHNLNKPPKITRRQKHCKNRGGVWDGTNCVMPPKPVAPPKITRREKRCNHRGGVWNGTNCVMPPKPVAPPKITRREKRCNHRGGVWDGTNCVMPHKPARITRQQRRCERKGGTWTGAGCAMLHVPAPVPVPSAPPPLPPPPPFQGPPSSINQPPDAGFFDKQDNLINQHVNDNIFGGPGGGYGGGAGGGGGGGGGFGPLLEPLQPGLGPENPELFPGGQLPDSSTAHVGPVSECDPSFSQTLPRDYPDQFGPMTVLKVFCGNKTARSSGGGSPFGAAPVSNVEAPALADVLGSDGFFDPNA